MTRLQSYNRMVKAVVILMDMLLCGGVFHLFCVLLRGTHWAKTLNVPEVQVVLVLILCSLLCNLRHPVVLYRRKVYSFQVVAPAFKSTVSFAVLSGVVLAIGNYMDVWSYFFAGYLLVLLVCTVAYRLLLHFIIKGHRSRGRNQQCVVLLGSGENFFRLYSELTEVPWAGYKVEGYFDHRPDCDYPNGCAYLGKPQEVIGYLQRHAHVDSLFCCLPPEEKEFVIPVIDYCENHMIHFYGVPDGFGYLQTPMHLEMMGTVPCLSLRREPLSQVENKWLKRGFDVVFSLLFLCTLFPFIFLVVAVVTKCTMPGPLFFKQKRNGLNDREFTCYKFRSMKVNAEADRLQASKGDPRITRWGHILRKTNLDETPQFFNVLRGDMSVVGPRPHMLKHTEEYSKLIDKYMVRHFVRPGITGWSQINGLRGETKSVSDMEKRIRFDIWYIEHWSFAMDLYIVFKTVVNLLRGEENAY